MKILVLEDNESIREAVASFLTLEDNEVLDFGSVEKAKSYFTDDIDLFLLDIMLPDGNGYIVAKELRAKFNTPIIFLTAKESESERIKGFEIGCDDYITKPFSLKELSLRIKAVSRRAGSKKSKNILIFESNNSELVIDKESHRVKVSAKDISLTPTEWSILLYLAINSGSVLSKERILEYSLGYNSESSDRIIITHVKNIREKLGGDIWIETVRGFGYRFTGKEKASF